MIYIGVAICISFGAFFAFGTLGVILQNDLSAREQLFPSFLGAFLAFLFVRLGEGLTRLYQRQAKNHTTIIELQHIHNMNISVIDDNRLVCKKFLEAFNKVTEDSVPVLVTNKLMQVRIDFDMLPRLTNLDLINTAFRYYANVRKFNDDADVFNESFLDIKSDLRARTIDLNIYKTNIPGFKAHIEALDNFLARMHEENLYVLAMLRELSDDPTLMGAFIRFMTQEKLHKQRKLGIDKHLSDLRKELDDSAA